MTEANHEKATEAARDLLKFGNEPEIFLNLARAYIALRAQLAECREALEPFTKDNGFTLSDIRRAAQVHAKITEGL